MTRAIQLRGRLACVGLVALVGLACTDDERAWGLADAHDPAIEPEVETEPAATQPERADGFTEIAAVLQSPRCRNCHPAGDAPLQTDQSSPHAMNITRLSAASGLECETCHQESNIEAANIPGAPHWGLPPADTPMVFEGQHPDALCRALRDPSQNGGRSLADLLAHVRDDPLVLWGWAPGLAPGGSGLWAGARPQDGLAPGGSGLWAGARPEDGRERSVPAISHAQFVDVFAAWVAAEAPCAGDPILDAEAGALPAQ